MNTRLKSLSIKKQESLVGYIFIIPFVAGFLIFGLLPMLFAVTISFMDINDLKSMASLENVSFAGFDNYKNFFMDTEALHSFLRTFTFAIVYVPALIIISLLLAVLMNKRYWGKNLTSTFIFMPYVSNIVAIGIVMSLLLDPSDGPVNQFLRMIGIANPPQWLIGQHTALPTTALVSAWQGLAFYIIVYSVALRNVPKDLYEAASIDGATPWKKFFHITLPQISPTTFMLSITAIIGSLQNFAIIKNLTNGGPGNATTVASMNIMTEAFEYNHFSYATSQAIVLFAFCLLVTFVQWRGQKRWVHY
ncbi:multiple sugar transport system permease protein [Fontibacillus solani]|uniref:Multiple sugar transport system permease protein n=1 Tax=Fontibacillus solani TaxID=1572857 RepID=A0A7W3XTD7_9BACL|nr:sugar ABC transporter permease [Fontibacillus solani]MBA9087692.1 multiple sugar transport system permease protein [Fontibacillus solani]